MWLIHSCLRIRKRSFFFILNDCCSLVLEFLSKLAARAMWHDIVNRGKRDETFATFWTTKLSNFMLISQFGPVSGRRVSVVYPLPRSFTVLHSQWQIYWLWNKKTSFCRRVSFPSVKSLEIVSNDFFLYFRSLRHTHFCPERRWHGSLCHALIVRNACTLAQTLPPNTTTTTKTNFRHVLMVLQEIIHIS